MHLARRATPASPTARTPSRCARPTPPATPTRRPRASPGRSTPPRRTRRSPPSRATRASSADADFSFSSTEAGSTFECRDRRRRAGPPAPARTSYTGLADGAHTFEVRATDAAGNTDATPASFTWTIDTAAPDTSITAQPTDPTNETGAELLLHLDRGRLDFECSLDGGGWSPPAPAPKSYTGLADGSHTFQVRATDAAGNTDATPATLHLDDRHRRAEHLDHRAARATRRTTPAPSFAFTSTEAGSTFECRLDGGAWSACTSPEELLGPRRRRAHLRGPRHRRRRQHRRRRPRASRWTVDTAAPDTTIDDRPDETRPTTPAPSFSFTSTEAGATFECRLDGGGLVAACTSPEELHRPRRRRPHLRGARDRRRRQHRRDAGELRAGPIDTAAPNTTITAQPERPDERHRRRASPSPPPRPARPSSAASTAAPGARARARRATPASPTARTPSRCARPTLPATPDATPGELRAGRSTRRGPSTRRRITAAGSVQRGRLQRSVRHGLELRRLELDEVEISVLRRRPPRSTAPGRRRPDDCRRPTSTGTWSRTATRTSPRPTRRDARRATPARPSSATLDRSPTTPPPRERRSTPRRAIRRAPRTRASPSASNELGSTFECRDRRRRAGPRARARRATPASPTARTPSTSARPTRPGNVDASPGHVRLDGRHRRPNTTITSHPSDPSRARPTPSFAFTSSEAGSDLRVPLDGGAWSACTSPKAYTRPRRRRRTPSRCARPTRPATPTRRLRRFTWSVDTGAAEHDDHVAARATPPTRRRRLRLQLERGRLDVRVPPRRRRLERLHVAEDATRASPTARTPSTCARPTRPATPTRRRRRVGWTIDTAAPDTTITAEPERSGQLDRARASRSPPTRPARRFECRLDGERLERLLDARTATPASPTARTPSRSARPTRPATPTPRPRRARGRSTPPRRRRLDHRAARPTRPTTAAPTFSFTSDEAGSTLRVPPRRRRLDACPTPEELLGPRGRRHTFDVRATDAAGNTDPTPGDVTPGRSTRRRRTRRSPRSPATPTNAADAELRFTSTRPAPRSSAASTPAPGRLHDAEELHGPRRRRRTPSTSAPPTRPATPTRRPRAYAGRSTRPRPTRTITSQPNEPAQLRRRRTSPSPSSEAGATFECRIDGGAWRLHVAAGYTGLADGPHTFDVRATDAAGNTGPDARERHVDDRHGSAEHEHHRPADDPTNSTAPSFSFSSSESGSTFECNLDAGALERLPEPEELLGSRGRPAHLPGPLDRCRRQHGRDVPQASRGRSTPSRPTRRSTTRRRARPTARARASTSRRRAARRSSAGWTAAPGVPAPARRATRAWPRATTPSTSAQPTPPATPTPRPRRARGRST